MAFIHVHAHDKQAPRQCARKQCCSNPAAGCLRRLEHSASSNNSSDDAYLAKETLSVYFRHKPMNTWYDASKVNLASLDRINYNDVQGPPTPQGVLLTLGQKAALERKGLELQELSRKSKASNSKKDDGAVLKFTPLRDSDVSNANDSTQVAFRLEASRWVGRMAVPGVVVNLAPKPYVPIGPKALLQLQLAALGVEDFSVDDGAAEALPKDDFALLLACAYARKLARALQRTRGAICDYRSVREPCAVIRGRIDVRASLKRPLGVDCPPLVCRYDELTIDTPQNQLLKAAALRVTHLLASYIHDAQSGAGRSGIADTAKATTASLRASSRSFGGVTGRTYLRRDLDAIDLKEKNARYRPYQAPLRLAKLILAQSATEMCEQRVGISLLINMDSVFERFVIRTFNDVLKVAKGKATRRGERAAVLTLGQDDSQVAAQEFEPDFVSTDPTTRTVVGDAKHKRLHVDKEGQLLTNRDDVFQMLSYMHVFGAACGVLVYAACDPPSYAEPPKAALPFLWRIKLPGASGTLVIVCLDLTESIEVAAAQLRHAAEHCKLVAAGKECDDLSDLPQAEIDRWKSATAPAGHGSYCEWCRHGSD